MSRILTPWRQQPQVPVGIDWSNPITRGLVLDIDFNGGVRDRVSGMIATPTVGMATPITTSQGVAARFSSTVYSFGDVELFNGAEAAWQILEIPDSLTQVAGIVNKRTNFNTQNSFSMGYNYSTNEFEVDVGNAAGTAGAAYRFSRAGFSTSGNNIVANINVAQSAGNRIKAWRNGASLGVTVSTDSVGSVITNTTAPLEIGRVNSTTNYYAGNLLIVRAWNRVLSDAEIQSISQNPWQIFAPLPRRIFVGVSAASGDGTGTGSLSDIILSPFAGSASGTGAIDGSGTGNLSALSLSAATATALGSALATAANTSASIAAPSATAAGDALASGALTSVTLAAITGSASASGAGQAVGQIATVALTSPSASAVGHALATGDVADLALSAPTGTADNATNVVATGSVAGIAISAFDALAIASSVATAGVQSIGITAVTGGAVGETPLTDSQKIDLILDILSNRQTLDPVSGVFTLYADDGTTVLKTALAYEDAAGTILYRGKGLQRLDALE